MLLAIISDIHEDIVSLQFAIRLIEEFKVDYIICLGDIVGFESNYYNYDDTRSAHKCVGLINRYSKIVVAGNHDLLACGRIPENANLIGFPENWYDISMNEKERYYDQKFFIYKNEAENDLNSSYQIILKKLESWEILNVENESILFSHFIYPDINGNLLNFSNAKKDFSKHFNWMESLDTNISFVGHAHIQGVGIANRKGLKINKFGKYTLKDELQLVFCPAIAKGKFKNGFVLFDTKTKILEIISLS